MVVWKNCKIISFSIFSYFGKHLCNHNHMHKINFITQLFEILLESILGMSGYNHAYLKKAELICGSYRHIPIWKKKIIYINLGFLKLTLIKLTLHLYFSWNIRVSRILESDWSRPNLGMPGRVYQNLAKGLNQFLGYKNVWST